jgi:hypothetical protein
MEIIEFAPFGGGELFPAYHMRLVRKPLQWCYRYSGVDVDYRCFGDLADALLDAVGDLFDVVIIDDYDVVACKCLNCNSETARKYRWICKSLKNNRSIPTTTEVVVNDFL